MRKADPKVREDILSSAEALFAERGYEGTSVQDIVDGTKVTKPVLYHYFGSKAGIYKSLVDAAYDETFRLMQEAAARSDALETQLVEIIAEQFTFLLARRSLVQIAIAAAFAAPGELPDNVQDRSKGERNFEFIHVLIKGGLKNGILNKAHDSRELALAIYGALSFQVMVSALEPKAKPDHGTAERIVGLFLDGARSRRTR